MGASQAIAFLHDTIWQEKIFHGGWISAEGRPGAGATFEFALPRRERR